MPILLTFFFSALTTLALVHALAQEFFLYWKYLWFDIPMHMLGGVCVALGYALLPFFRVTLPPRYTSRMAYLVVVLMVGIAWESFEYAAGISIVSASDDFILDTTFDLIMDLFGGLIGYGIVKQIHNL